MAQYDTVTKQVTEDITVTISKKKGATSGEKLVAFLKWYSEKIVDPDYGVEVGLRPDNSLPGGGGGGGGGGGERPTNPIAPGGERPSQGLPGGGGGGGGSGNRPDQGLPGGQGGTPDQ